LKVEKVNLTQAQEGAEVYSAPSLTSVMGMGGERHDPAVLPPENRPGTQGTGGPKPVLGAENLAPTGIRSPDSPARNKSLNQLSYFGPHDAAMSTTIRPAAVRMLHHHPLFQPPRTP